MKQLGYRTMALLLPVLMWTGCGSTPLKQVNLGQMVADYSALRPSSAVDPGITMAEAQRTRDAFVEILAERSGPPVGHKVGLVTQASQKTYGVSAPVRGVLFKRMLLPNKSQVSARFGVRPMCEADLVVVVQDKGINRARSIKEAAEHLSEVVAFIELPDSFLSTNAPVTGAMLAAANVGARFGVLGDRALIRTSPAFLDALATMKITMTDQTGAVLGQGQGKDILGHPLHSVLWLKDELRRAGRELKPGDLISLGGINMITPQPGQTITVAYEGLPGKPLQVSVSFY